MAEDLETLCARAQAATLRAKQLVGLISASQRRLIRLVAARKMLEFRAHEQKIVYPQDFPEKQRAYQAFPIQGDEDFPRHEPT